MIKIPVEISARHIHLSQKDLGKLFGAGFKLTKIRDLSQLGEFAAKETVKLITPAAGFNKLRIVGPVRKKTQVEITATDCRALGITAPVMVSGKVQKASAVIIKGPKGQLAAEAIIAQRHLHLSLQEAKVAGLKNGQKVSVKIFGKRSLTFHEVAVRAGQQYRLSCHLDTDEANAAGLTTCGYGELIK